MNDYILQVGVVVMVSNTGQILSKVSYVTLFLKCYPYLTAFPHQKVEYLLVLGTVYRQRSTLTSVRRPETANFTFGPKYCKAYQPGCPETF